jgi:hypothetical protein
VRRDQLPPNPRNTFVLERYRVVYVSTPKAACTSLKWVVAGLGGEDPESFARGVSGGTTAAGSIHTRGLWRKVPQLSRLSDEKLGEIDAENGWHVFAVVRHPTSRLWSAWQQKLLMREPHMLRKGKTPRHLVPGLPKTTRDVVEAFQSFVAGIARGESRDLMANAHFAPQTDVLAPDRVPYTRIYTVAEMPRVMADLDEQVRAHGGGPVKPLPASNETPLKPLRSMFTAEVLATVQEFYAADFRRWFPDGDLVPPGTLDDGEYPPTQLAEIGRLVDRHARIGQLATEAERLQKENDALRQELERLRAR